MAMQTFKNFLDKEIKKAHDNAAERENRINEYVRLVNDLYSKVDQNWLAEFIPDKISTGLEEFRINEEPLGSYSLNKKWLQVGNSRLYLLPVGTLIVGSKARVDLVYGGKSVMFLWMDKDTNDIAKKPNKKVEIENTWKIVTRGAGHRFIDVDSNTFQRSIMELMNG